MPGELSDMLTAPVVLIAMGHSLKNTQGHVPLENLFLHYKENKEKKCMISLPEH